MQSQTPPEWLTNTLTTAAAAADPVTVAVAGGAATTTDVCAEPSQLPKPEIGHDLQQWPAAKPPTASSNTLLSPPPFGPQDKKLSACRFQTDYFAKERSAMFHPVNSSLASCGTGNGLYNLESVHFGQQPPQHMQHHHHQQQQAHLQQQYYLGHPAAGGAAGAGSSSGHFPILPPSFIAAAAAAAAAGAPTAASTVTTGQEATTNATTAAALARSCALPSPTIYPPTPPPSAPWMHPPWFLGDTF